MAKTIMRSICYRRTNGWTDFNHRKVLLLLTFINIPQVKISIYEVSVDFQSIRCTKTKIKIIFSSEATLL